MEKLTFKDYLMLETEIDTTMSKQDQMRALQFANKNPEGAFKKDLRDNVDKTREIQQDKNDPNKSEKLRLLNLKKQAQMQQKKVVQKEKNSEQAMGIEGDTGERPGTGLM